MDPVSQYARMAAVARMGELLTPNGTASSFTVMFPSYHDASAFIRRAGGGRMDRAGKAWRWTMPDGIVATLPDESDTVEFTRPEGGDE